MIRLDFFVEEESAEHALIELVPKILPDVEFEFEIYTFQGKPDLLKKLPDRLAAYRYWIHENWRIIILIDRDSDDCHRLKADLEAIVASAGLKIRTAAPDRFHVINRIAIEELEAWFFGDTEAIHAAYPGISPSLSRRAPYRDPDAVKGGTWEQLERLLVRYHPGKLEKLRAAQEIAQHMDPDRNRSHSFQVFRDALRALFRE